MPNAISLWKNLVQYLELQPLSLEERGSHRVADRRRGRRPDDTGSQGEGRGVPLLVRELVLGGLERQRLIEHHGLWRWRGDIGAGGRLLSGADPPPDRPSSASMNRRCSS